MTLVASALEANTIGNENCAVEVRAMRTKFATILAAAFSLGVVQAASAADMPMKAPALVAAPAAYSWTGFYVGANAGGAWGRDAIATSNSFPVPPFFAVDNAAVSSAASATVDPTGFIGGVQAGYNMQMGQWLLGVEADFDYMGLRGSNGGTFQFPSTLPGGPVGPPAQFFSTATSVSTDWLFTLRPRVGWVMNNWLVYATGGLAVADEKFSQTLTLLAPFVSTNSFTTTRVGWTVGGGVEYALNRNWSVKGEYLYVDLGTTGVSGGVLTPTFAGYANASTAHLTINIARAGINYHF